MPIRLLTTTEDRIARLAAAGLSDEEVAAELGLSTAVVAIHRSGIYRKLGARSPAELPALLPPVATAGEAT